MIEMMFYSVTQEYYDNGRVAAWVNSHAGANDENDIPKNCMESRKNKDVYVDYFASKAEAIKFCDGAKKA